MYTITCYDKTNIESMENRIHNIVSLLKQRYNQGDALFDELDMVSTDLSSLAYDAKSLCDRLLDLSDPKNPDSPYNFELY